MANILGLNFGHDGAAAVVKDNKLVCAISNERISRQKKAIGVTPEMLDYVLDYAGLKVTELDFVAFSSFFFNPNDQFIQFFEQNGAPIQQNLIHITGGATYKEYLVKINGHPLRALLIQHHVAHCASTFYTSPFDKAACLSVDASGVHPEYCSLYCYGQGNQLHYFYCPGIMLGNVYSVFTAKMGIGPGLTKAGSTMALASFGKKLPYCRDWRKYSESWYERVFQPSDPVYYNYLWHEFSGLAPHEVFSKDESDSEQVQNIAASLQYVFEEVLLEYANLLHEETSEFSDNNLCLTGGSFLNSDANMQIRLRSPFERFHLFPGCGDDGTAVGAALYVCHHLLETPRVDYAAKDYMYLGKEYSYTPQGEAYNPQEIARAISEGKIVAWFNGRSEFGPRALGNRSLLADPRSTEMKDLINAKVKHREWYRPFAPSVLSEKTEEWFDIDGQSKLMLFIAKAKRPEEVPAIVHVDKTSRLQTVEHEDNPDYYELIQEFDKITGVPLVLNTSLNDNNEPLVESPEDA